MLHESDAGVRDVKRSLAQQAMDAATVFDNAKALANAALVTPTKAETKARKERAKHIPQALRFDNVSSRAIRTHAYLKPHEVFPLVARLAKPLKKAIKRDYRPLRCYTIQSTR